MTDRHNVRPTIESLCEHWPCCLAVNQQRPLNLRIDQDIAAAAPGAFTPAELELALRFYTGSNGYLLACREGNARINLLGNVVGAVTKDESEYAAKIIARRKAKHAAKPASNTPIPSSPPTKTPAPKLGFAGLREAAARRKAAAS